jgi:hypothetical protein
MPEPKRDEWHLSLSVHRDLFDKMVAGILPVKVGQGSFHLLRDMRGAVARLELRQKVAGLLEDRHPPEVLVQARERAVALWRERRETVHRRVDELLHVEGEWKVQIEEDGSSLRYGSRRVGLEARVKLTAEGTATLVQEGLTLPFALQRFVAASLELGNIHYDRSRRAIVGDLGRPVVDLGEHVLLQLVSQAMELALERQLFRVNPVTLLTREQVEGMVKPASGPFKLELGVEDLDLAVDERTVTLHARFGFTQRRIEQDEEPRQIS